MEVVAIVLIALVVLLALVVIGIYNRLVGLRQSVNQGVADIDAQLRQRHDRARAHLLNGIPPRIDLPPPRLSA